MPSTPALPSLFLPRVTSRRVAGAPPPLILGRESSHLRRIVATRTVRVGCGAHLPLCVRDHQRRPYRDALTALDDTSTWPTTQVSLSDASRRLRVLLVEAPLHAYLVSYSLHHVSTSLTMIADSSCDRIGLFESSHTMHKPLACHFRTTTKGTRSTPPLRDRTCGVSTQSASLTLTYTPGGYGGAAAATDTAHGSRDGGVGRHPPSHPCRHRAAARSRRGGRGWRR